MDSHVSWSIDPADARRRSTDRVSSHVPGPHPETTSIEVASSRLGIGRSLGYQLAREGRFPCRVIRAGRRLLVPTAALERVLAGESAEALAN
jgi:hypothetical protein